MDLVTLRNKINTVRTVEKITHIMRLTSMSEHTNLQKSGGQLKNYIGHLTQLLKKITKIRQNSVFNKEVGATIYKKPYLCIIIGSQKGLCGNFNAKLLPIIEAFLQDKSGENVDFTVIGKQIIPLISTHYKKIPIIYQEDLFSKKTKEIIVDKLISFVAEYQNIYIISNEFRSFFSQIPTLSLISIPQETVSKESDMVSIETEQYILEEPVDEIFNVLVQNYIRSQFFYFLHQSLLAEHAARFSAMDSATRNAQNVLEETKMLFNKLRQTKITTEIIELSSNF